MKRAFQFLCVSFLVLIGVLLVRAWPSGAKVGQETRLVGDPDRTGAAQRLAAAVTYPTVSRAVGDLDTAALEGLHTFLIDSFPNAHAQLEREVVGGWSLLYRWPGRDREAPPLLLLGHLDVVPVPAETAEAWSQPPFGGVIADGYVWGRGTLDDKVNVLGALEAVELLLAEGFTPDRTILFAFGHDEEVGGADGAARIAALLEQRRIEPWFVLDEGLAIVEGVIAGLDGPAALLGIAEKGYVSLELVAHASAGHSSMPPKNTAIGRLARALQRLEAQPMPAGLDGPTGALFDALAPAMPFTQRLALRNRWLFAPLIIRQLAAQPGTAASLRTTTAPTMLNAGVKDNVLPSEARAVVNFRIHPRDSVAAVEAHVRAVIDDESITVAQVGFSASEPSAVSPVQGGPWDVLSATLRAVAPEAVIGPSLVLGATDARHYERLSEHVYRFSPVRFGPEDLARVHGVDERIGVDDYARAIAFYAELMRRAAGEGATP